MTKLWQQSGAVFHARMEAIGGKHRATFWISCRDLFGSRTEAGETYDFSGAIVARAWVNMQAKRRGFTSVEWENV